jgi:hypothetical protein
VEKNGFGTGFSTRFFDFRLNIAISSLLHIRPSLSPGVCGNHEQAVHYHIPFITSL